MRYVSQPSRIIVVPRPDGVCGTLETGQRQRSLAKASRGAHTVSGALAVHRRLLVDPDDDASPRCLETARSRKEKREEGAISHILPAISGWQQHIPSQRALFFHFHLYVHPTKSLRRTWKTAGFQIIDEVCSYFTKMFFDFNSLLYVRG